MSGICEYYSKMSIIFLSLSTSVLICRYVSSLSFSADCETLSFRIYCYLVESMLLTSTIFLKILHTTTKHNRVFNGLQGVLFFKYVSLFFHLVWLWPNSSVFVLPLLAQLSSSCLIVLPPSPVSRLKVEAFCLHLKRKAEMSQPSLKVERATFSFF